MSIDENLDRDLDILEDVRLIREPKRYRDRHDPFELADNLFYSRYRFDKISAQYIMSLLDFDDIPSKRGLPISKELQVLTALRFFGRNAHQEDIADLHGISQPSVSRIITRVSEKLALQFSNFIKFPTEAAISEMKKKFYNIAGFPCVLGVIDCTHVRIKCPTKCVGAHHAGNFLNRKGYYSLNVQIVCDADYRIIDIVARSCGSRHDARIWNTCNLKSTMGRDQNQQKGLLLGDSAYPNSNILLTPFRQPHFVSMEERFNRSHIKTRSKIECLNGQIKSKFRSIFQRLRVKLSTAKAVIIAVAILHNISKERNISFLDSHNITEGNTQNTIGTLPVGINSTTGLAFRQAFLNIHFR